MARSTFLLAAALLPLAACNSSGDGTEVAITANGSGGSIDRQGEVTIDTPVFEGSFRMPAMNLTAENFDINGVHLYPGTKIGGVKVDANGGDGAVSLRFESPADVATVRGWLAQEFAKAGTRVSVEGNRLTGNDEDKTFTIDLTDAGGKAAGVVTIGN